MIKIADKNISQDNPPFVIAEMSGNHNQSLDRALKIVRAAADAGVHALKLQTYTPDTMTLDLSSKDFIINDKESLWKGYTLYDLYKKAHTRWEWHKPIFEMARKLGLIVFSTPFDSTAVDFLEDLNVPCYKVASFENTDLPLIKKIAATGKPMIISTGMASIGELDETIQTARESGCNDIILLKCTSTYPATPENTNILTIPHLKQLFKCEVGISDHTMGIGVSIASVALGASVVEKHFTLNRDDGGVDSVFSLEPHEMRSLVLETEQAWHALGRVHYGPTKQEEKSLMFRRSIYITHDMKAGGKLSKENMRIIRPGYGLAPKYFDLLMGKSIKHDVKRGTPVEWGMI